MKRATFIDGKKVPVKLTVREQMHQAAAMADDYRSRLQWGHLTPTAREKYEDSLLQHTKDWVRLKNQADKQSEK